MTSHLSQVETPTSLDDEYDQLIPLSDAGNAISDYVRQAPAARKPVGYDRAFLEQYEPNTRFFLMPSRISGGGRNIENC